MNPKAHQKVRCSSTPTIGANEPNARTKSSTRTNGQHNQSKTPQEKGFFELNTVVALVLPLLLMADCMLIRKSKMGLYAFRVLAGTQIALVLVILGSALMRMGLYQTEFGQSELRLYV